MKDFKFKFSRTAVILSVLAIALALGGAGWTIYRIIRFGFPSFTLGLHHRQRDRAPFRGDQEHLQNRRDHVGAFIYQNEQIGRLFQKRNVYGHRRQTRVEQRIYQGADL